MSICIKENLDFEKKCFGQNILVFEGSENHFLYMDKLLLSQLINLTKKNFGKKIDS
jgi:hypothetical protein